LNPIHCESQRSAWQSKRSTYLKEALGWTLGAELACRPYCWQRRLVLPDMLEYQRLCQPDSADFILNLPDYYAFFTYKMFQGKVPEQKK
jgi:demethylmenaquinone methyltransferase/2-methoxy-6-polyprenyl-1,4-benzoquinol methylase